MADVNLGFKPRLRVLSDEQVREMHLATLELLERTGVVYKHAEALELLHGAGAHMADGGRVRIPAWLLEDAIRKAPPRVVLADRSGDRKFYLEDGKTYFSTIIDCPYFLDPVSGKRRPYTLDDARIIEQVCNALPLFSINMAGSNVTGLDPKTAGQVNVRQALVCSEKALGVGPVTKRGLVDIYEMAAVVRGGEEALRLAPNICFLSEPVSPLYHGEQEMETILFGAERGIPVVCWPCPMAGGTAPVTLAGLVVQANAEFLSALLVAQLKSPGAPFVCGAVATVMDLSKMVMAYGAPELSQAVAALCEMAHFYRLPFLGTGGCTDSHKVDLQAAVEATFSMLTSALMGANLVHDVAMMDQVSVVSPEFLVLLQEVYEMIEVLMPGVPVSSETLALDVMDKVGPGGSYLAEEHTLRHFREIWYPRLFDRTPLSKSGVDAGPSLGKRLRERTLEIIEKGEAEPLPPEVIKELDRIAATWS